MSRLKCNWLVFVFNLLLANSASANEMDLNTALTIFEVDTYMVQGILSADSSKRYDIDVKIKVGDVKQPASATLSFEDRIKAEECLKLHYSCAFSGTATVSFSTGNLALNLNSIESVGELPQTPDPIPEIMGCFNIGSLDLDSLNEDASVVWETDANGKIVLKSISSVGPRRSDAKSDLIEAIRRAVLRCSIREKLRASTRFETTFDASRLALSTRMLVPN